MVTTLDHANARNGHGELPQTIVSSHCLHPQFEKFCGSDKSNYKPNPAIDLREGNTLNETERIQTPYKWYTDSGCRQYVKNFITKVVNRKNTINGRLYREDPTIFSWNLLNEPRCKYCGPEAVTEWYTDIAAHIKSVDSNHLVTTGEEGKNIMDVLLVF